MKWSIRGLFPYFFPLIFVVALFFALRMGSLPPADFTFSNGTEPQTVDPAKSTGAPEGRIIDAIFEGLYRKMPDPNDPNDMIPMPAMAESHEVSDDLKTYTFHMREGAKWTNGEPVTAHDWDFSWQRFLHPESGTQYGYQLWYIKNAKRYTTGDFDVGDRVEVELADRKDRAQMYPRGTIVSGILKKVDTYPEGANKSEDDGHGGHGEGESTFKVFTVDCVPEKDGVPQWDGEKTTRVFYQSGMPKDYLAGHPKAEEAMHVLLHFSEVGIEAPDAKTLIIELESPTPYFLELASFYPMHAVNRTCIETFGYPNWTKPENIVTNGPYQIQERRIRDRIRLAKNPTYWNADEVKLDTIDALAVQSNTTQLNMFMSGEMEWATDIPNPVLDDLKVMDEEKKKEPGREDERNDLLIAPMLSTYFYRVNTTRPPLDNPKVRQALNLAINKQEIVDFVTRGGQVPAGSLVPPGITGYEGPPTESYDPERARKLLEEALGGKKMRPITILYNTSEGHKSIAEVIQQQWKRNLHIDVQLRNVEWGVYLTTVREMDYDVARAGWIGDYPDPNTFLDMFVTGGENNETGWSNKKYDGLIEAARSEADPEKRFNMLRDAEEVLVDEMPILPIYFYVSINMVRPYVKNFYPNLQDLHPLHILEIDEQQREKIREWEGLE